MIPIKKNRLARLKRKKRVRKKIQGKPERPRLTVFKSARHIYAQIIDDTTGRTLLAASTISKDLKSHTKSISGNIKGAILVGEAIAKIGAKKGITEVIFDRNGFLFHGRVKALADAARENGLKF
ncbi:MAG: 50S ribosomal protein L18 [Deltaproteobacteria bacterium]|nr:50S ribosomal protein L18 [Deltaproteobacteria bacterium]OQY16336.1 MAG: 50S ribosomal protein L18 [Desulfobacterium sp. 4572_20]HDH88063.1 50S ribosomal protein L18 [Desulfobacteraceae bacterium]MBW2105078.1 50S ribosomal protein L18 [Deltaproteobacteria bacterium]MBW2331991.1 50S ribosomal protein L18 [Deltaproteobacteria bacterium]